MKIKDGHTDVASMRRLCKTIIEDCKEISGALPEQEAALPTWLTNKIAVSGAYLNSARDYLMYYVADGNDEIKSDSYHLEETGDIEEGSPTQTSGSYSFDFSGESSSETEEIKF